uniref:Transmembrane protein 198 n=1 Tax=Rhodosorus marinus TaxID=101924 RepID=A0A7S3ABV1_9RHOD|mmetsp:Transcript_9614/g.41394  ORF Transcript_9614/g.41394 Transcript_9614/m.41394 type:complete len:270 (+) Transcript_9614:112-921(+)
MMIFAEVGTRSISEVPGAIQDAASGSADAVADYLSNHSPAAAAVLVAIGVIVAFNGRHLLAPFLFVLGAAPGGMLLLVASQAVFSGTDFQLVVSVIAFAVGCILFGWLFVSLLYDLGVFLLGALLAVVVASILTTYALYRINPSDPNLTFYLTAAFLGSVFGLLALSYKGAMVPLSSAFVGSYVAVRAIAFFIGGFPDPVDFASQEAEPGRSIYTGIIVFLGGIAAYNQWRYDRVLSFPLLLIAPRRSKSDLETLTTFMRCAPFANRRL